MERESYRTVVCRDCGTTINEPPPRSGFIPERLPCPNCGGTGREYRLGLSAPVASAVVTVGSSATATSEPTAGVTAAATLERNIIWSKNPDAWLAEVRRGDGTSWVFGSASTQMRLPRPARGHHAAELVRLTLAT